MAHRTFDDENGVTWEAWDVIPGWAERRVGDDRRESPRGPESERRARFGKWVGVRTELAHGWLCFRSGVEKRRLAPIPRDWSTRSDKELIALLRSAAPAPDQSRSV